jgi:hypothetical protein
VKRPPRFAPGARFSLDEPLLVRRGAVDLHEGPPAVAVLANHAHAIRVILFAACLRRGLGSLREEPTNALSARDITSFPLPGVGRLPARITAKKGCDLGRAPEERFLGSDHHHVGVGCEELDDAVHVLCCKRRAETIEDLEQRRLGRWIGPHPSILALLERAYISSS